MANAKFQADAANNYAQLTAMNYKGYADMIQRNPVLGVTITPTLLAMAQAAERYGGLPERIAPRSVSFGPTMSSAATYNYGEGRTANEGMDLQQMMGQATGTYGGVYPFNPVRARNR
jgi:hypothetical protein